MRMSWWLRLGVVLAIVIAVAIVWSTNILLTDRYTESTRSRAQVRLALYSGNIIAEIQQSAVVPQVLARDPALALALTSGDYSKSSQQLISYANEIGIEGLALMDSEGRVVAATDRNLLGQNARSSAAFVAATRSEKSVFSSGTSEAGLSRFSYSQKISFNGNFIGVIVVEVDLRQFEVAWKGFADAVMVADSEGTIILTTEPRWRGLKEGEALAAQSPSTAIARAFSSANEWTNLPVDAYLQGDSFMRQDVRIPFQGWRMTSFTSYESVRERVNGFLALEIMTFAILLALGFYVVSRRARVSSMFFQNESEELRRLNQRLQSEIAEREKAEKHLDMAEQTLAQSSKLAALGEMSAAVSHELNQPLAAMKTYLAGAKLLLQRKRPEEAAASFQRIDDLIERMGAITKQLKSYARKGGESFQPVDVRTALSSALAMMEPQLKSRQVEVTRTIPNEPVWVMADQMRLEQVIINLFRNALDATKTAKSPKVDILLTAGETAVLALRDNGDGIDDLDSLFEPFYTTKAPGDGVGLGLAISSGIVNDFGGRLTARNAEAGGAVFEVQLPILSEEFEAAE
ncbi:ATP-binding protein [Halocynthiibacter sp. SDUM655004]|uniref:C4-dicarboxylate transport sensor protein DctB n=2 Tax=Paracoccaceae TaxID=31989 RepID=A0AAE3IYU2_9RHOB|nr:MULTISPECIES: ATP-binding protein [Halocynthiibacter]MCV6824583.1 ATP-binding protein [Halocynthiibacter halioticoli]MCW4057584.1 ATP-binding protein [Halocynthiibacter sp. SDUM655004]MDE0589383.1 ATP-binding protein [Halocynthiibacter sp. C4]